MYDLRTFSKTAVELRCLRVRPSRSVRHKNKKTREASLRTENRDRMLVECCLVSQDRDGDNREMWWSFGTLVMGPGGHQASEPQRNGVNQKVLEAQCVPLSREMRP